MWFSDNFCALELAPQVKGLRPKEAGLLPEALTIKIVREGPMFVSNIENEIFAMENFQDD